MLFLLCMLGLAQEQEIVHKDIMVAPPTIDDEALEQYVPYLTSVIVAQSNTDSHWVRRTNHGDTVSIHDKYTINLARDTVCDYNEPLKCGVENIHWVLVTDIFTAENFATIIMKMYGNDGRLIATTTKSSYSVEKCRDQTTKTTITQKTPRGQSQTEIVEQKPDKCVFLKPKILDKDLKQAVTILFASIRPL
tara:strand:- start:5101 stop:5676 length:576 start_codon:yes stop_codon:yes gene_type:complete